MRATVPPEKQPSPFHQNASLLRDIRILVVEEDPDTRVLYTLALEDYGANVFAVGTVQEAMEQIDPLQPHLLISEIKLAGEDGYSLIRQIRAREQGKRMQIPALAITGLAQESDRLNILSAGFQQHLAKPIDLDDLVASVARLVQKNRLYQPPNEQ